uniref:F-box/FBD/LRR-repeat protein At1g13570-like n=1 Tax=Erigeron canadensis TaxID=72917 RepID=UPI001CB8DF12|nr:F-box/FBD/LRR-repeat protein At1g13570-like [Erigeron canadensis]
MIVQEIHKNIEVDQGLNLDIISTLPLNIIENILTLMPIKDAWRTSILSREWRYCWTTMPRLVFDKSSYFRKLDVYKLVNAILHVLLLHKGPIEELNIDLGHHEIVSEIDQIILHLSRINNVKRLIFNLDDHYYYKLPQAFFSLQELEYLHLSNCYFEPPVTFHGFSGLKTLRFFNVRINPQILKQLLSNCPLLDELCLSAYEKDLRKEKTFTFVELLSCVPLIETLQISEDYMKYLATGSIPKKLPTSLVNLKYLFLDVCLMEQDEIYSAFCIIRSSPNLEQITFEMRDNENLPVPKTSMYLLDLQDDLSLNLDHLKIFDIENFSNFAIEIKLVELFMAKSPMLRMYG